MVRRVEGHPFAPFQVVGEPIPLADVRLLAPVIPSKVVAIGRNYADHAAEMGAERPRPTRRWCSSSRRHP